jgi:hypothetical protein
MLIIREDMEKYQRVREEELQKVHVEQREIFMNSKRVELIYTVGSRRKRGGYPCIYEKWCSGRKGREEQKES